MIREKGGAAVKLSQSNWVGRALSTYLPTQVSILDEDDGDYADEKEDDQQELPTCPLR